MTNLDDKLKKIILQNVFDGGTNVAEGIDPETVDVAIPLIKAAIAELVEGALPVEFDSRPPNSLEYAAGYNQAVNKIRNNLIKAGVLNG